MGFHPYVLWRPYTMLSPYDNWMPSWPRWRWLSSVPHSPHHPRCPPPQDTQGHSHHHLAFSLRHLVSGREIPPWKLYSLAGHEKPFLMLQAAGHATFYIYIVQWSNGFCTSHTHSHMQNTTNKCAVYYLLTQWVLPLCSSFHYHHAEISTRY